MTEISKERAETVWRAAEEDKNIAQVVTLTGLSHRTLSRLRGATKGFQKGRLDSEIAKTTGWSLRRVGQVHQWWTDYDASRKPLQDRGNAVTRSDTDLDTHARKLLAAFDDLKEIGLFPLHDRDMATWWSRPEVPDWPIPKGRAWRERGGSLRVELLAESKREWRYLQQHLTGSPVWVAVEDCKKALADDLAARLHFMDTLAASIQDAPEPGGLGLPIGTDLGFIAVTRSEVTVYYLFTIHDQVLSRALGLRHLPKRFEEFQYLDPGYPEVVFLGGIPVVRSTDPEVRAKAVSFLLEAQERLTALPEVGAAAKAYRAAEAAVEGANNAIGDLLLTPGFAPGSACALCAPWVRASESLP